MVRYWGTRQLAAHDHEVDKRLKRVETDPTWDVAAGVVLVREAGGFVNEINGKRYMLGSPDILATNDPLQGTLQKLLSDANS